MKSFSSEFAVNYATYSFGYCQYAQLEHPDELDDVYALGYLPYSANPAQKDLLFYRARSLRVDLTHQTLNKNGRYLERQFDQQVPTHFEVVEKAVYLLRFDPEVRYAQCEQFMKQRFEAAYLQRDRFDYILAQPCFNRVALFYSGECLLAIIFLCQGIVSLHYWFAFYEAESVARYSPGRYFMQKCVAWARSQGMRYVYLGTAYGEKSHYKFMSHASGVEFWDGAIWNSDTELLKRRLTEDPERIFVGKDQFKQA
jgi:hypothetical protein